jgi:hypothetical protein
MICTVKSVLKSETKLERQVRRSEIRTECSNHAGRQKMAFLTAGQESKW